MRYFENYNYYKIKKGKLIILKYMWGSGSKPYFENNILNKMYWSVPDKLCILKTLNK